MAQEVIHSMKRKHSGKTMAIKIDLHKAYDRLHWEFIEGTLKDALFPENFIKILMHYISSVSM